MDIQILEEKYHSIENSDSFSLHNEFIKELVREDSQKMLEFHLKLIDDCRGNRDLHRRICHAFEKRERDIAVQFLSEKLESSLSEALKADIIQILGILKSKEVLKLLPSLMKDKSELIRYKAIIVSGWIGDKANLSLLNECLQRDSNEVLRGYAATAMRQIWLAQKAVPEDILPYLYTAIKKEDSEETLAMIIIVIQDLLKRKFGLQECIHDGAIKGDVLKAKERIIKKLEL